MLHLTTELLVSTRISSGLFEGTLAPSYFRYSTIPTVVYACA